MDSALDVQLNAGFIYGETRLADVPTVTKRSWQSSISADFLPFSRVTPFMLASIESSLETRIVRRYTGGGGAKLIFVKRDGFSSNLSLALLAERSVTAPSDSVRTESVYARYAASYQLERRLDDRVTASLSSFYRPEFRAFHRFTAATNAAITYRLVRALALKASFIDNYDSESRARGALSNNDGALLFGFVATF